MFQRILFEESSAALNEQAADALLPLLIVEPGVLERVGASLTGRVAADTAAQGKVVAALQGLMAGLPLRDDRATRRLFRKKLGEFLPVVRSLIRTQ